MWKWHPENVRRASWQTLIQAMRAAVEIADRHEVTLAFEPERNNVVDSVARARMLLDTIGSPWLKVVIDPANLMKADDQPRFVEILDEAFEWLGPDLVLAHAKPAPFGRVDLAVKEVREYLQEYDPTTIGMHLAYSRMAHRLTEGGGPLLEHVKKFLNKPVPEAVASLYRFYLEYVKWLKSWGYRGALVLHGQPEPMVALDQAIIVELLGRDWRNG
jgi:hypothetical protein